MNSSWVNEKFYNILVVKASLQHIYHVSESVQAMKGTCYGL